MHEYVKYVDGTLAVFSDIRKKDNGEEYIIVSFERPKEYGFDIVIFELPSCNIVKRAGHYTDDEIAIFKTVVERGVGYFFNNIKKEDIGERRKKMLDEMHKQKIDMSDEIYVINVGGYIGESTKNEIEYAKAEGKKIDYLECIR